MDPALPPTLAKLAIPAAACAAVLFVARRRGLRARDDLGLCWPPARVAAAWLAAWVALAVAEEFAIAALGMEQPQPWAPSSLLVRGLRIAAIGVVGPFTEELAVRGLAYWRLARTRLGPGGAVVVTALVWAALHVQYEPATMALIVVDGLVLGLVRWRTGSVLLPFSMHAAGNLYSIWQSLHA